jgi:DNA-binding response OmpR family regulator
MVKQILIVDDDRELSRMLRATLELFDRSYKIIEVPSAEEAMLEARRYAFDLVIADVRLPGMDGVEMLRRIRKLHPTTQVIIITGGVSPSTEAEARNLNVTAFFPKPLNTDDFIFAVQKALGQEGRPAPRSQDVLAYSPTLADRLSALRRDLGCLAVYLADQDGRIVARAGDVSAFDLQGMLNHIVVAFSASLKVCSMIGGVVSQNLHFFDGDEYDVYVLNVGQTYILVMLYSGDIGARQMGQVARYGRLAADDMLNALADTAPVRATVSEPVVPVSQTIEITSPDLAEPIVLTSSAAEMLEAQPMAAAEPAPMEPAIEINAEVLDAAAGNVAAADLDSFWDQAMSEPDGAGGTQGNALSFEQALKLGLTPKDDK